MANKVVTLPPNYVWIPGHENRYAVKYLDERVCIFEQSVYSFITPGAIGPYKLWPWAGSNSGIYRLYKNRARIQYTFTEIARMVKCRLDKDNRSTSQNVQPKAEPKLKNNAVWVIAELNKTGPGICIYPVQYNTASEASSQAEEKAKYTPSKTFVVLKTVRKVTTTLSVTDLVESV